MNRGQRARFPADLRAHRPRRPRPSGARHDTDAVYVGAVLGWGAVMVVIETVVAELAWLTTIVGGSARRFGVVDLPVGAFTHPVVGAVAYVTSVVLVASAILLGRQT